MLDGLFSQDTEEIAELLVTRVMVFIVELKGKGSEALPEIGKQKFVRQFSKSASASEGCSFYIDGKLNDFFFDIVERKRFGHFALVITAQNDRYNGFRLDCDLLTRRVTVDARDTDGKRATGGARKLCKVFAQKYALCASQRRRAMPCLGWMC